MTTDSRINPSQSFIAARRLLRSNSDRPGLGFPEELLNLAMVSDSRTSEVAAMPPSASPATPEPSRTENSRDATADNEREPEAEQQPLVPLTVALPQQAIPMENVPTNLRRQGTAGDPSERSPNAPESLAGEIQRIPNEQLTSANSAPNRTPTSSREAVETASASTPRETWNSDFRDTPAAPMSRLAEEVIQRPRDELQNTETMFRPASELANNLKPEANAQAVSTSNVAVERRDNRSEISPAQEAIALAAESPVLKTEVADKSGDNSQNTREQQPAQNSRSRRLSRQERIRDERSQDGIVDRTNANRSGREEPSESSSSLPSVRDGSSPTVSSQQASVVSSSTPSSFSEAAFTVAGQSSAPAPSGAAVSNGAGSDALRASVAGAAVSVSDSLGTDQANSQPVGFHTGRGETRYANGQTFGRTEGATGSDTLSRYQQNKLVQRVLKGLEQLSSGGGQVKLRLHPPELGTLQMTLKIEANVMSVRLEVENSLAKDALFNNLQSLRDRLSEQGMTIDRFDVEVTTDSQSGASSAFSQAESNGQSRRERPESRFAIYNDNLLPPENAEDGKPAMTWFRTTGQLDLSV
ncbi:flagellar hook-length control protein FliK [Pirellulaceae bacterium SH449]